MTADDLIIAVVCLWGASATVHYSRWWWGLWQRRARRSRLS